MRYYIKYHGQEECEVTKDAYTKICTENHLELGTSKILYCFYGPTASGRIDPEDCKLGDIEDTDLPSGAIMISSQKTPDFNPGMNGNVILQVVDDLFPYLTN